jgi:hypothetical protein
MPLFGGLAKILRVGQQSTMGRHRYRLLRTNDVFPAIVTASSIHPPTITQESCNSLYVLPGLFPQQRNAIAFLI